MILQPSSLPASSLQPVSSWATVATLPRKPCKPLLFAPPIAKHLSCSESCQRIPLVLSPYRHCENGLQRTCLNGKWVIPVHYETQQPMSGPGYTEQCPAVSHCAACSPARRQHCASSADAGSDPTRYLKSQGRHCATSCAECPCEKDKPN